MNRFRLLLVSILVIGFSLFIVGNGSCNQSSMLCGRRYNEVAYPATHNGHSHEACDVHNQDLDLKEQFERGIRATKLHVWYHGDGSGKVVPYVCHGIDKALLYNPPVDKALEQVPLLLRPVARSMVEKADPLKELVLDAFYHAYGTDNSTGAIPFKHCLLDPARKPLVESLTVVREFLEHNPEEVMTLILEDHTRNLDHIVDAVAAAGLVAYVHTQQITEPWPTLREMIKANKRLVIFLHGDQDLPYSKYPWLHYIWDYAWDTCWEFKDAGDLRNCKLDKVPCRGEKAYEKRYSKPHNKVFIVHHFVTGLMGGCKQQASKANKRSLLRSRLQRLQEQTGHIPNIIQVDFFELPSNDLFEVVDELNGIQRKRY